MVYDDKEELRKHIEIMSKMDGFDVFCNECMINLRQVKFGDLSLDNIKASVVKNQSAPLLLGQSILARLGKIEIDNAKRVIKITYEKPIK